MTGRNKHLRKEDRSKRYKHVYMTEERWEVLAEARDLWPEWNDAEIVEHALRVAVHRKREQEQDSRSDES